MLNHDYSDKSSRDIVCALRRDGEERVSMYFSDSGESGTMSRKSGYMVRDFALSGRSLKNMYNVGRGISEKINSIHILGVDHELVSVVSKSEGSPDLNLPFERIICSSRGY